MSCSGLSGFLGPKARWMQSNSWWSIRVGDSSWNNAVAVELRSTMHSGRTLRHRLPLSYLFSKSFRLSRACDSQLDPVFSWSLWDAESILSSSALVPVPSFLISETSLLVAAESSICSMILKRTKRLVCQRKVACWASRKSAALSTFEKGSESPTAGGFWDLSPQLPIYYQGSRPCLVVDHNFGW